MLLVVLEGLFEQAAVIGQADAVRGKAQRRKTVDKAGCQSAQAAVAQGGLILELLQLRDLPAGLRQLRFHVVIDPKVDQVVAEQLSDQKFCGNIVQFLLSAVVSPVPASVLRQLERRIVEFQDRALAQLLAGVISQFFVNHKCLRTCSILFESIIMILYTYFLAILRQKIVRL